MWIEGNSGDLKINEKFRVYLRIWDLNACVIEGCVNFFTIFSN